MHAGRHKQDGPDVPVEVDPRNNLLEGLSGCPSFETETMKEVSSRDGTSSTDFTQVGFFN